MVSLLVSVYMINTVHHHLSYAYLIYFCQKDNCLFVNELTAALKGCQDTNINNNNKDIPVVKESMRTASSGCLRGYLS